MIILLSLLLVGAGALMFAATYKVVDPNEAHVVVFMGRGRKVYSPYNGGKTAYFFIPLLMKRFPLPLTNVKMAIDNIELNDQHVAPFICDVITWLHIADPIKAAERLTLAQPFESLHADLINIVQAVARAVAMKQEILEIMKDRQTFSNAVSKEVGGVLSQWGVELINLEVNDIRDDIGKESKIISDYEGIRKAQVSSLARQEIANRDKEAVLIEQQAEQEAEIARAKSQEAAQKRHIEKDKTIAIEQANKELAVAQAQETANAQQVLAQRKLEVGQATVKKEAQIETAMGVAEAVRIQGEKEAEVITLKGKANASATESQGLAEAKAKDAMAEAMAKFNDAATNIEKIRALVDIEKAKYEALGLALSSADLKLVQSGKGGNIFGFPLNAETGADLGQMLEGIDLNKIKAAIKS